MSQAGFSIIICTHNGIGRLEPTLAHIAALEVPVGTSVELIVVDNASTDHTNHFTREVWKKLGAPFSLVVLNEKKPGKGYAVETGYDAAQFSYILTVDDDNWLQADYLTQALQLLQKDPSIGVLQGHSSGVFEVPPPPWVHNLKQFFIIGGPKEKIGYFPQNDFSVWGAGMLIRRSDWLYLRNLGYASLTSKLPGKAAGEDNELAIGLLLLGRKIYYSDRLQYKHFMPRDRVNWEKLKKNFETFGYVHYYFFLYSVVINSYYEGKSITIRSIRKDFFPYWLKYLKSYTLKQQIAYFLFPKHESYQLHLLYYYAEFKWFWKLHKAAIKDIKFLQSWVLPLLKSDNNSFQWPL